MFLILYAKKKKKKKKYKMAILESQSEMILTIFHLQVAPILPTKFRVNWPFGSKEAVQNRFSRTILAVLVAGHLLCFRHLSESRFLLDALHRRSKLANFCHDLMQNHLS